MRALLAGGRAAALAAALSGALPLAAGDGASDAATSAIPPPPPAPRPVPWSEEIAVNAFVSASWGINFNDPDTRTNQLRVFDFDDRSFAVDVVELVLQKAAAKPGDGGFRVDLAAGSSIPRVSSAYGLLQGEDVDVQQAFVSWIAPVGSGLRFDLGKFVTHLGYETIDGYDGFDDDATRSFLFGYAIPFTHTGLKVTYAFSDQVTGMAEVVNGWDAARDDNAYKSFGAQVAWTPSRRVGVYANVITGAERPDSSDPRTALDVVAQWKLTDLTVLTLDATYGTEKGAVSPRERAVWAAVAAYARLGLSDRFALCLRGEWFDDRDGARTGTSQRLTELTLTPELKLSPRAVVRADLRVDRSSGDVFRASGGRLVRSQPTLLLNALYVF